MSMTISYLYPTLCPIIFFLKNKDLERYLFIEACGKIVDYVRYLCTFAHVGQKWVLDLLELELQVVVSCWMWVLGTKLESTERAVNTLNR